jgi:hypothetical protein
VFIQVDYASLCLCSKEAATDAMVYSYKHGFSGFAAKFTESQAHKIAGTSISSMFILVQLNKVQIYISVSNYETQYLCT